MVNRVELIGNLTRDPELRYSPDGTPYCYLRLATNRTVNGVEYRDFHFVVAWRATAELSAKYLHIGNRAYVEGRLETSAFATPEGRRVERTRIVANRVLFLSGRPRGRASDATRDPERTGTSSEPTHIADVVAEQPERAEQREPAEEPA